MHARRKAVVYAQSKYVGSLTHFTERFKLRLVEMARSNTELSVRTAVTGVLSAIDENVLANASVFSSLTRRPVLEKPCRVS